MTDNSWDTGYTSINGARIFYQSYGKGFPLVFVHAGIADRRMWEPQLPVFEKKYRVITYDMRGYGKSEMPAGYYAHHRDLARLLDYFGISKAHIVGLSLGGREALNFTLENPGRVAKLVLVDSGLGGYKFKDQATIDQWPAIEHAISAGRYEQAAELEMRIWVAGPSRDLKDMDPSLKNMVKQMLIPTYATPPEKGLEELLEPPAASRLWEVKVPTLIMCGELDVPDMQTITKLLVAGIQGARRVTIPGAAHLPNLEKPAEFNQAVLDFLAE